MSQRHRRNSKSTRKKKISDSENLYSQVSKNEDERGLQRNQLPKAHKKVSEDSKISEENENILLDMKKSITSMDGNIKIFKLQSQIEREKNNTDIAPITNEEIKKSIMEIEKKLKNSELPQPKPSGPLRSEDRDVDVQNLIDTIRGIPQAVNSTAFVKVTDTDISLVIGKDEERNNYDFIEKTTQGKLSSDEINSSSGNPEVFFNPSDSPNEKCRKPSRIFKRIIRKPIKYSPSATPKRNLNLTSPQNKLEQCKTANDSLLCCGKSKGGRMVRCSNWRACDKKWFHYEGTSPCVDYNDKKSFKKTWYCPGCTKNPSITQSKIIIDPELIHADAENIVEDHFILLPHGNLGSRAEKDRNLLTFVVDTKNVTDNTKSEKDAKIDNIDQMSGPDETENYIIDEQQNLNISINSDLVTLSPNFLDSESSSNDAIQTETAKGRRLHVIISDDESEISDGGFYSKTGNHSNLLPFKKSETNSESGEGMEDSKNQNSIGVSSNPKFFGSESLHYFYSQFGAKPELDEIGLIENKKAIVNEREFWNESQNLEIHSISPNSFDSETSPTDSIQTKIYGHKKLGVIISDDESEQIDSNSLLEKIVSSSQKSETCSKITPECDGSIIVEDSQNSIIKDRKSKNERSSSEDVSFSSKFNADVSLDESIQSDKSKDLQVIVSDDESKNVAIPIEDICDAKGIDLKKLKYIPPTHVRLEIPIKSFQKVYDREKNLLKKDYPQLINKYLRKLKLPCSFNAKDYWALKKGGFTIRGYCGSSDCGIRYKCVVQKISKSTPVQIDVFISGDFTLVQKQGSGRQLRGGERSNAQKELTHSTALKVWLKAQVLLDDNQFLHQNNTAKSVQVLRTAKSEAFVKSRIPKTDVLLDCIEVAKELAIGKEYIGNLKLSSGYIQKLSAIPFSVAMYAPIQVQFGALTNVWNLDATGSICESPYKDSKKVLLHTVLGKVKDMNLPSVPIFEFLTNSSKGTDISSQLKYFMADLRKLNPSYQPAQITVDFSFAYLHACSEAINVEPLMSNINRSYDCMLNGLHQPNDKSRIQICLNHVIHAFSRNLTRNSVEKPIRQLALHGLAKLIEIESLDQLKDTLTQIISVFGSKNLTSEIANTFAHDLTHGTLLQPYDESMTEFLFTRKSEENLHDFEQDGKHSTQREQSKYYQMLKERILEIQRADQSSFTNDDDQNPYYSPQVLNILVQNYFPYFPLWSNTCPTYPLLGKSKSSTNGCLESYFGTHKNNLHKKTREYAPQYIKEHAPFAIGLVSNVLQKALTSASQSTPKAKKIKDNPASQNREDETTSVNSQECWNKSKPVKKQPLYARRDLKSYFKSKASGMIDNETPAKMCTKLKKKLKAKKELIFSPKKFKSTPEKAKLKLINQDINFTDMPVFRSRSCNKITPTKDKIHISAHDKKKNSKSKTKIGQASNDEQNCSDFINDKPKSKVKFNLSGNSISSGVVKIKSSPVDSIETVLKPVEFFNVGGIQGFEVDLSTLFETKWLNDSVMHAYAESLLLDHVDPKLLELKQVVIGKSFAIYRHQNSRTGKSTWVESIQSLPTKSAFDSEKGTMHLISHNYNHWWLITCDFGSKTIKSYDSGRQLRLMDPIIKTEHVDRLKKLFQQRYNKPFKAWKYEEIKVTQQLGGHECGPLTLANLDCILRGVSLRSISPYETIAYRGKIAKRLCSSTEIGRKMMHSLNGDVKQLLNKVNLRAKYISLVSDVENNKVQLNMLLGNGLQANTKEKHLKIDQCLDFIKNKTAIVAKNFSKCKLEFN